MRKAIDSPFSPGADAVPQVWAGRTAHLSDWRDVLRPRRSIGMVERGRTVLGEAGTGKSALVRRIAAEAGQGGDWVTPQLRIPSGTDPLRRVAAALVELAQEAGLATARERRIAEAVRRVEAVAVSGVSVALRPGEAPEAHTALTDLLVELGRAAMADERVVVLHLDEVQNIASDAVLSQVLIALGDALAHEVEVSAPGGVQVRRGLPLVVYLTGLPEFADMAGGRTGATFARRFQTTTLGALDDDDVRQALQVFLTQGWEVADDEGGVEPVTMTPQACEAIVTRACGEPFLFQLAGAQAWYAGTGNVITAEDVERGWALVADEAETHVCKILDRLPERERQFVDVMAGLEPQERTLTRIAEGMGLARAASAGPTSQRLDVVRGIVRRGPKYSFRHRAVEAYLTTSWPRLGR